MVPVAQRYAKEPIQQLEQMLTERSTQQSDLQKALADANSLVITAQTRPERAQAEISTSQTRIQQINNILKAGKDAGKTLSAEQRDQLNAELAALNALIPLRRQELAGNSQLQDLGNSQHDLLSEKSDRLDQEIQELQTLINQKRLAQSQETVTQQSIEAQKAGGSSLLATESAANLKLSDYLLKSTDRLNEVTQQNLQTKQQLDSVTQSDSALDEQINVLKGSLLLSKILYKQKQALPRLKLDRDLADQIADIRLYQFEVSQQRELLSNPATYVDNLLATQPPEQVTPQLRKSLLELATTRADLLERLNRELSAVLNESITLQLNQKQLLSTAQSLRATLDEQMFWIPSNKPLDLEWMRAVPERLERQVTTLPWASSLSELTDGLTQRPLLFLPLALSDRCPAVAAQKPVCPTEQGSPGHRPLQARQPVAHAAGDSDQHSAGDAGLPGPGLVWPGLADRRPRAERQHGRGAAANGPGLAGVLHRLPDPRAGRRGRTAFPLGKTPGRIPPGLGPPTRAGGDGAGRGGGRRRTATGGAGR